MIKKLISITIIIILSIYFSGCSKENSIEVPINNDKGKIGDGSKRRGGADKLDRMKSGEGGRKQIH